MLDPGAESDPAGSSESNSILPISALRRASQGTGESRPIPRPMRFARPGLKDSGPIPFPSSAARRSSIFDPVTSPAISAARRASRTSDRRGSAGSVHDVGQLWVVVKRARGVWDAHVADKFEEIFVKIKVTDLWKQSSAKHVGSSVEPEWGNEMFGFPISSHQLGDIHVEVVLFGRGAVVDELIGYYSFQYDHPLDSVWLPLATGRGQITGEVCLDVAFEEALPDDTSSISGAPSPPRYPVVSATRVQTRNGWQDILPTPKSSTAWTRQSATKRLRTVLAIVFVCCALVAIVYQADSRLSSHRFQLSIEEAELCLSAGGRFQWCGHGSATWRAKWNEKLRGYQLQVRSGWLRRSQLECLRTGPLGGLYTSSCSSPKVDGWKLQHGQLHRTTKSGGCLVRRGRRAVIERCEQASEHLSIIVPLQARATKLEQVG
jgi:hypothetical protein